MQRFLAAPPSLECNALKHSACLKYDIAYNIHATAQFLHTKVSSDLLEPNATLLGPWQVEQLFRGQVAVLRSMPGAA